MSTKSQQYPVSRTNIAIKAIIAATFPQWKGRTVKVVLTNALPVSHASSWSGGSRVNVNLYNVATGGVVYGNADGEIRGASAQWVLVEHSAFCGKDAGITIRAQSDLTVDEISVVVDAALLDTTKGKALAFAQLADIGSTARNGMAWTQGSPDMRGLHWACVEGRLAWLAREQKKLDRNERAIAWVTDGQPAA